MLKKLKTKKALMKFFAEINPQLTKEGIELLAYYTEGLDKNELKLSEVKKDIVQSLTLDMFKDESKGNFVISNIRGNEDTMNTDTGDDDKAKKSKKSKTDSEVTEEQIIKLVGYRYARPIFPATLESTALGEYTLTRVDVTKIKDLIDLGVDNLIVATYFPAWDSEVFIDPVHILEGSPRSVLKKNTGSTEFPNDLDLAWVYDISEDLKVMSYTSAYTGIPYVASLRDKWFKVEKTLNCRVNNYGHDYAFYIATKK